jgi:two-component system, NtrC family, response regulator AtoC
MSEKEKILVVDDEENLRHMLQVLLKKNGFLVDTASNGGEALEKALRTSYTFILCDIKMPDVDGPEFLRKATETAIQSTIIMMSAYGTIDTAIECMKLGAYDYISKPFKNEEIILVLRKAEERERLKQENIRLHDAVEREFSFSNIISKNKQMQEIFTLIKRVCDFKTTVLILGESGTGKELIAKAIHYNSKRKNAAFVALNCGAIPENLLESELFGHVKGAFTDAGSNKSGLFEQADHGTLFLDEIGEMPAPLQVKLLRVLQEGEIRAVGSSITRKVDVRVISATSRNLGIEVEEGRFREDLFYRLNVFKIQLPPLRERAEDIPLLVEHFLEKHCENPAGTKVRVSQEALKVFMCYQWPGNIRELENCIERGLILCDGDEIGSSCLPDNVRGTLSSGSFAEMLSDCLSIKKADEIVEKELIRKALEKTCGNRTHAARLLEISHRALLYKLKEYGMD